MCLSNTETSFRKEKKNGAVCLYIPAACFGKFRGRVLVNYLSCSFVMGNYIFVFLLDFKKNSFFNIFLRVGLILKQEVSGRTQLNSTHLHRNSYFKGVLS